MAKTKCWSYNAGVAGTNWVRAYEDGPGGWLFVEWREGHRRKRLSLKTRDRVVAVTKAEELARRFAEMESAAPVTLPEPFSLDRLLTLYVKEVTPTKGESMQDHERRAARLFRAFFAMQEEPGRRIQRHPGTLDRVDWERFCEARLRGRIAGWEPVGRRQVGYDLQFLLTVLGWATGAAEGGVPLLERNPWGRDWRRSQKLVVPRNPTPHRPAMTDEIREALTDHSPHWQFDLALLLERETRRRNNAIRQLRWSDLDMENGTVEWRGELDKCGRANLTPLTQRAIHALRQAPSRAIGPVPVFPSATDAMQPTPRDTFQTWLRRAKARSGVEAPGLGFHGEKRAGVRDPAFRKLPPPMQEAISGTNYDTLRRVYDEVSVEDLREAFHEMERRQG